MHRSASQCDDDEYAERVACLFGGHLLHCVCVRAKDAEEAEIGAHDGGEKAV